MLKTKRFMVERRQQPGRIGGAIHIVLLLVLAGAMIVSTGTSDGDAGRRLASLPLEGLSYRGQDLPLTATERELLGAADARKRLYQTSAGRFLMMVVDGSRNSHAVHDPLYCFRGRNFHVCKDVRVGLPSGDCRVVSLTRGQERKELAYWFTDGKRRHSSFLKQRWQAALIRLGVVEPEDHPLMVTIQPLQSGMNTDWLSLIDELPFLAQL